MSRPDVVLERVTYHLADGGAVVSVRDRHRAERAQSPRREVGDAPESDRRRLREREHRHRPANGVDRLAALRHQFDRRWEVMREEARQHRLVRGARRGTADRFDDCRGLTDHRIGVDHDDSVDRLVGEHHAQGLLVLLGTRTREEIDRITHTGVRTEQVGQRGSRRQRQFVDDETGARARIGGEDPRSPTVPDDRHPPARWQRLVHEHTRDVEHLRQRVDPDDPGLPEQRVGQDVVGREGGGVRRGGPLTGLGSSALHGHDRLVP